MFLGQHQWMLSSYIQLQRSENIRLAILTLYKGSPAGNVTDISALASAEILLFLYFELVFGGRSLVKYMKKLD